jgi:indolepyruvate ferredoxin oxidoreductase beta subunit
MAVTNVLISGVGGQGTILASNVLAEVALRSGLDVKQSEVHGMSQRGGNVVSMVRFGERVASPLVARGEADILLAFEEMEGLRYIGWLRPAGRALINRQTINPAPVNAGLAQYPAEIEKKLRAAHAGTLFIDASRIALEMGNVRVANVILLGAMSLSLGFQLEAWDAALRGAVPPKALELNLRAFRRGQEIAAAAAGAGLPA